MVDWQRPGRTCDGLPMLLHDLALLLAQAGHGFRLLREGDHGLRQGEGRRLGACKAATATVDPVLGCKGCKGALAEHLPGLPCSQPTLSTTWPVQLAILRIAVRMAASLVWVWLHMQAQRLPWPAAG